MHSSLGAPGLVALFALDSVACSRDPGRVRGADPGWDPPAASARAAAPRRDERWDIDGQLRFLKVATKRARSEHRGGELEGEVFAKDGSGYPPRGPAAVAPPGTTLVERLFAPGGAQPLAFFVMVKASPGFDPPGGDWEYLVVSPSGVVDDRGKLAACARCHAEAPQDRLFGGPRDGTK